MSYLDLLNMTAAFLVSVILVFTADQILELFVPCRLTPIPVEDNDEPDVHDPDLGGEG